MTDCEFCKGKGTIPCRSCIETGIGQFGDPDTSKCGSCGGKGYTICSCVKEEREAVAYDHYKDQKKYGTLA